MFRGSKWSLLFARRRSCLAVLAGCSYTSRNALPPHISLPMAIPVFKNKTFVRDYNRKIEVEVTEAVRNAFIQNGELSVVGRETADLIVEGEVTNVDRQVLRSDRFGEAAEVRLSIKARISVYDVKEAKYLIQNEVVSSVEKNDESGAYNICRGEDENVGRQNGIDSIGKRHRSHDHATAGRQVGEATALEFGIQKHPLRWGRILSNVASSSKRILCLIAQLAAAGYFGAALYFGWIGQRSIDWQEFLAPNSRRAFMKKSASMAAK